MYLYKVRTMNGQEMFLKSDKSELKEFIIAAEEIYTSKFTSIENLGLVFDLDDKSERVKMKQEISEITRDKLGDLLHTISVECSYVDFKDAEAYNAISFIARTEGKWEGKEVKDLDYAVECSIEDARGFAKYILSLCDEIETEKG